MSSSSSAVASTLPDARRNSVWEALRLKASAAVLRRLIAHMGHNTQMRTDLGDVMWDLGRHQEAITHYRQSLAIDPRQIHALLRCGLSHIACEEPEAALHCFSEASKLAPDDAELHFRRATALGRLGRVDDAIQSLQRATRLDPLHALAHNQLGVMLMQKGRLDQATGCFDQALQLDPKLAKAACNQGMVRMADGQFESAREALNQAVALDPQLYAAHANLGMTQLWLRQPREAESALQQALKLQPADPIVTWNLALLHLMQGDWRRAWPLFEARWEGVLQGQMPHISQPQWRGDTPLQGQTILVHPEQGLGDFVQCCRYLPLLSQAGAKVLLSTPHELVRLMRSLPGDITVIPKGQPVPPFDLHIPIMSLPGAFRTAVQDVPAAAGYLAADPEDAARWAQRLGPRQGLRVGLVWSGGRRPDMPELSAVNVRRNITLRELAPLAREGITFYSLQKGKEAVAEWRGLRARQWTGPQLIDLMDEVKDFADTAALIEQLDLVITVDTSTAHVAAALGKPVWLLNRHDSCWRWMFDRTDSPWYDSVTVFRQAVPGQWAPVVADVAQALASWQAKAKAADAAEPLVAVG
jgi:Flp pilus assembly protein TadD